MSSEGRNRWVLIPKTEAPGEKAAKTGGLLLAGTSTESPTLKRQVDDNEFHSCFYFGLSLSATIF